MGCKGHSTYSIADASEVSSHFLEGGLIGLDAGLAASFDHLEGRLQRVERVDGILGDGTQCQRRSAARCHREERGEIREA